MEFKSQGQTNERILFPQICEFFSTVFIQCSKFDLKIKGKNFSSNFTASLPLLSSKYMVLSGTV